MKELFRNLVVAITIIFLSGCGGSENGNQIQPSDNGEPSSDLGDPDGVALTFLNAWEAGDYEGMYSLLSANSQAEFSVDDFVKIYESASQTMTLREIETQPQSVTAPENSTTAQVSFTAVYHTMALGDIEQNLNMLLVSSGDRWGIAWSPAMIFPQLAGGNTLQLAVETPSRANIYDRNGLWMVAADASAVTLTIVPGQVSTNFEERMLTMLSSMLRMSTDDILKQYSGLPADWVVALGDVDLDTFNEYRSEYYSYPGLDAYEKTGRRYYDVLASHVLGYVQQIPAEQLDYYRSLGYQGDELVGISGLESWGEQYLAGERGGTLSAYSPGGEFFAEIARKESQPAQSLYTTIDRDLQAIVQDALESAYRYSAETWVKEAGGASVVVMDVNTGAILAMASYPFFDPNVLHPYNNHPLLTQSYLNTLFNNPLRPFLNRSTQGQYPAGSVFKIVTAAAGLDSGVVTDNWAYESTGTWSKTGFTRYDWKEGGHGLMDIQLALTTSCNSCFYELGYETGVEDFSIIPDMAAQFLFGRSTGVEIEEKAGLLPTPDWMWRENNREWTIDDSVNLAIGQGSLLVTPLQIVSMISTIANGGTVYKPYLVDRIGLIGESPTIQITPTALGELSLTDEQLSLIQEAMFWVTSDYTYGTAEYRLGSLVNQMPIAGKTGTAQVSGETAPPIAWFAGYAPYENPEIAIVVMIENGGQGSGVAAPIFRRIVERWYGLSVLPYPEDWADPEKFEFVSDTIGE